jgi:hypothetical protein
LVSVTRKTICGILIFIELLFLFTKLCEVFVTTCWILKLGGGGSCLSAFRFFLLDRKAAVYSKLWICPSVVYPHNCAGFLTVLKHSGKNLKLYHCCRRDVADTIYFCGYENNQHIKTDLCPHIRSSSYGLGLV